MKYITRTAAILTLMFLAGFATIAQAQRPYRLSEGDLKQLISRLEQHSDQFRKSLDSSLDRSRLDGSRAEDRINDFVKAFEEATDRLKDRFDDNQSASATVQEVLDRAASIDRFMVNHHLSGRVSEDWMRVRADLDELASTYSVAWNWPGVDATISSDAPIIERHARRINDSDVKAIISRIDAQAERFRHSLRDALNHSRFNHTGAEDDINAFVKNFEKSTERLKDHFGKHNAAADDAEEVMRRAASIDTFMRAHELSSRAQEDWQALRRNLDELAAAYNVSWRWE
jgi:chromatin segregation and condensation protein Rec8/ScpA/Scc1 (kleisin family)